VGSLIPPGFNMCLPDIEMTAVQNRPEAVEAGLDHLSSQNDLRRAIVKYFPKVSGFWRYTHDKDKYLYNKDWKEVGVNFYFDLLDWLANVDEAKGARSNADKTFREMGTIALGITSQVRLAALQYFDALDELRTTQKSLGRSEKVLEVATTRASRDDLEKLALEDARANVLQGRIERTRAIGEANAALGELQGTLGTNFKEPLPGC
jgi:outer membrane protein TolC